MSSSVSLPHPLNPIRMHAHPRTHWPRAHAHAHGAGVTCSWDMGRGYAALLTRASADMHARARAPGSCVFPTGASGCTTTGWRACRRPSSPALRASSMSRSLSPRPHTLARTRNGTCSALLISAFPVASLAFLSPFLCTTLSYAELEYPYEAWISIGRVCMLCGCASVSESTFVSFSVRV